MIISKLKENMGKRRRWVEIVRKRARQSLFAEPSEPYQDETIGLVFSENTVRSKMAAQDTDYRQDVTVNDRLAVTLRQQGTHNRV
jgi:hypothetical protein